MIAVLWNSLYMTSSIISNREDVRGMLYAEDDSHDSFYEWSINKNKKLFIMEKIDNKRRTKLK